MDAQRAQRARDELRRRRSLLPLNPAVPLSGEGDAKPGFVTVPERKEKPLPRFNIHCGFWILASIGVTYYADFFKTLKENLYTSSWFLSGGALLLVSFSIAFYCIVYLEWYRGIEYDMKYPALVPVTTASFIAAGICFNVALWPVWSFLTPLLLFTQFMGVIMFISLLG
ncbi:transmembrane protein 128 [Ochotona princeps]|uniref:transmembrane protein 128 n=1 Tax=Ochotona princeps TaxID=9978 RepID=UPI00032AD4B2|nr:transmembrane protein 128 [Ochotona princeps]